MNEKMARNFILSLSKKLNKEDFASLVSYFSITQGVGSTETPDLRRFPQLKSDKEKARLVNRIKSELNYLGVSLKRFNQGVRLLEKLESIKDDKINHILLEYVKNIDPHEEWLCLINKNEFELNFSFDDKGSFSRTTTNRNHCGNVSSEQERYINIDLLSLIKITQAIHLELNIDDSKLVDTLEAITHTVILHERQHLYQYDLDDVINKMKKLKIQKGDMRMNFSNALDFIKFYLNFEYKAWEAAVNKDLISYRRRIVNEALCNMSLTSYIMAWFSEIYFDNTFTLPHEDITFKLDINAPDCF